MGTFLYDFLGCKIGDIDKINWSPIGILIINILFVFFIIKTFSDYYKLSLRGNYRNTYQKLLFLDIFTLNIFSVIGISIFIKNKWQMLKIHDDFQVNNELKPKVIKDYCRVIFKIEMFIFLINLTIFVTALICGYYIQSNIIKIICLAFTLWSVIVLYAWSGYRIIGWIVVWKMLKNLINDNSYYYLLTTIRFLPFILGISYNAILINLLRFDEDFELNILENW